MDITEADQVTLSDPTSVAMDLFQTEPNSMIVGEFQGRPNLQSWPSMSAISSVGIPQTTDERVLEYLTHYRYKIAPWVSL